MSLRFLSTLKYILDTNEVNYTNNMFIFLPNSQTFSLICVTFAIMYLNDLDESL